VLVIGDIEGVDVAGICVGTGGSPELLELPEPELLELPEPELLELPEPELLEGLLEEGIGLLLEEELELEELLSKELLEEGMGKGPQ
jgi:hypothetical protein